MEYKITFLNDNEEHTIAELGENALENAQNSLEVLLSLLNTENCKTGVVERLFNYGLEFCPVPYNEDEGGKIEYYCYLIPYGGPSKEVSFYPRREVRFYPHRTEFVYLDWSSGVGFDVSSDEIFQQLRDWFGDLLDFSAEV